MSSYKRLKKSTSKGIISSINTALEGVVHTLKSERNMRVHFLIGFLVLIVGIYLDFSASEFMLLCFAVTSVLAAELFNTAIEHIIDLVSEAYHPLAKLVKDIAAGAVFVSCVNALVVGYVLLIKRIADGIINRTLLVVKETPWHVTLIIFLSVIGLVLFIKVRNKEKHLLSGGMPSGHAAVAFASWVIISFVTQNILVSVIVFFLAVLIAKSRITVGVHSIWQVVAGSLLGALVALLIFQLLS